ASSRDIQCRMKMCPPCPRTPVHHLPGLYTLRERGKRPTPWSVCDDMPVAPGSTSATVARRHRGVVARIFERGSRQHTWPLEAMARSAFRGLARPLAAVPWSGGRAAGSLPLVILPAPRSLGPLEAFLVSTGIVALSELGDKTQLLAMVLAARFRQPVPIILAILVATLANHALAGLAGTWLGSLGGVWMRWIVAISFA